MPLPKEFCIASLSDREAFTGIATKVAESMDAERQGFCVRFAHRAHESESGDRMQQLAKFT